MPDFRTLVSLSPLSSLLVYSCLNVVVTPLCRGGGWGLAWTLSPALQAPRLFSVVADPTSMRFHLFIYFVPLSFIYLGPKAPPSD